MDQKARARLNTLAMTKPDKAQMVENMILQVMFLARPRYLLAAGVGLAVCGVKNGSLC